MRPKTVFTAMLLTFVAVSVIVLVAREMAAPPGASDPPADGIVLYYFHGPVGCATCDRLRAACREAIDAFPDYRTDGRLRMVLLDYTDLANEDLRSQFAVAGLTVVVAEVVGGRPVRSQRLDLIWDSIHDRAALVRYLTEALRAMLEDA